MKRKYFIACIMALMLVLSLFPAAAYAEEGEPKLQLVYSGFTGGTMTFYYDSLDHTDEGTVYYNLDPKNKSNVYKIVIDPSMKDYPATDAGGFFRNYPRLTTIEGMEYLDTSSCTSFSYMFESCASLAYVDISSLDMSNAISAQNMFSGCSSLYSIDFSGISAPKLTNVNTMFNGCTHLKKINLTGVHPSGMKRMAHFCRDCNELEVIYSDTDWYDPVTKVAYANAFQNASMIKGGDGTVFSKDHIDSPYAVLDKASEGRPGYFTDSTKVTPDMRNDLKDAVVILDAEEYPSGSSSKPKPVVMLGSAVLTEGVDYKLEYLSVSTYATAGRATIKVIGIGDYEGICTRTYMVKYSANRLNSRILLEEDEFVYDGTAKTPKVYVNGIIENVGYTLEYSDNVEPGTAHVTVKGIGDWTGSTTVDFIIKKVFDFSDINISKTVLTEGDEAPVISIDGLEEGRDFVCEYDNDPTALGEHRVIIKGAGDYAESASYGMAYVFVEAQHQSFSMDYFDGAENTAALMPENDRGESGIEYAVSPVTPKRNGYEFISWELDYGLIQNPEYTVYYRDVQNGNELIASYTTTGAVGEQINLQYQPITGYGVHSDFGSLKLDVDKTNNVFTFWYEPLPKTITGYSVKYDCFSRNYPYFIENFFDQEYYEGEKVGDIVAAEPKPLSAAQRNALYYFPDKWESPLDYEGIQPPNIVYMKLQEDPADNQIIFIYEQNAPVG